LNNFPIPKRLPVDVREALHAICSTGKGRCWYCDLKLPEEARAVSEGWDVQRMEDHPVASIILVCPECLGRQDLPEDSRSPEPALAVVFAHRRPRTI
jgi:hypothetical protein